MTITLPPEIIVSDKTPRTAIAFDKTSGVKQISDTAREVLLVGQQLSTATIAALTPTQLTREDDGANYAGAGSMIDQACRAAFFANPFVLLSYVGIADGGVKAHATVTFATNAGITTVYRLRIAFVEVDINVTTGDTPTVMATNLAAAINANVQLPVTATASSGIVTITANQGGTVGNGIALVGAFDAPPAQVVTTATLSSATLASGTGAVSIAAALAAATGKRYPIVACLLDDSVSGAAARDSVNSESDAEHDHGEICVQIINNTLSASTTLALALNGPRHVLGAIHGSESWAPVICATMAAAMSTNEVATVPYNGMVLNGICPPPIANRWQRTETRTLIDNGVTPLFVKPGELVAIMRAVSTGVTNTAGSPDYSTLDITKFQAFDFFRDNVTLMFEDHYETARWADSDPDGLLPSDVATPEKVTIDLIDVARDMEALGIIQNVEALKDQFVVEKVGTNCQFSIPAAIVDGMHEKLGKIVYINRPLLAA